MSEITRGVMGMPYEMAMGSELSRRQFYEIAREVYAENERLLRDVKNDSIAYKAAMERQEEIRVERDQLKAENEVMKAGIDPKWGLMDQSILLDYLREQTNFCAEKFDGMIQFAVDAANRGQS